MDSIIVAIATISTTDPTDGRGTSMFAKQGRHLAAFLVPMKTEWFVSDGALRQNTDDRFMAKDANAFAARQLPVMAPSRRQDAGDPPTTYRTSWCLPMAPAGWPDVAPSRLRNATLNGRFWKIVLKNSTVAAMRMV